MIIVFKRVFVLVLLVLLVLIVLLLVLVILLLFVLLIFIGHENHPTFRNYYLRIVGCLFFYNPNSSFAFFAEIFKISSVVCPRSSATRSAVKGMSPEWQSFPRNGSGAR